MRGPYQLAFFRRHNAAYRIGAAMHFFHSKQHDLLQLTPLDDHLRVDEAFERQALDCMRAPPVTEPEMDYYSSYVDRAMHGLFRAIDWTHMHHEQTYDIMSDGDLAWAEKKRWTDRAVGYYLSAQAPGIARSPAPLDITMRRAAVMMKPYFTLFRNYYPRNQSLFFVAHWWHPAVYEALTTAGNARQEVHIEKVIDLMWRDVIPNRPQRMLLSRELMPRYSMMSPESANIFDNLHMLHGIAYDILAYEGWSAEDKRAEMYRVLAAMSYQPGDERLARRFPLPTPTVDPLEYGEYLFAPQGEMTRIMSEMLDEMMPSMMPSDSHPGRHAEIAAEARRKGMLGVHEGEQPGSLHDALMSLVPDMRMDPQAVAAGGTPVAMVRAMLDGWTRKNAASPPVPELDMHQEPG